MHKCKIDGTPLHLVNSQRTPQKLKKQYYYSAYYQCPTCKRIYFDDKFKIINTNYDLFTGGHNLDSVSYDIEIWTDGASSNNGRPHAKAAWAFVTKSYEEGGLVDGKQTNNRGEALAIYHALLWASGKGYKKILLHTDSQITLHGVAKHPDKVKENRDIFQKIYDVVTKNNLKITYHKVLGHSGDPNNERADKVAVKLTLQ
jgi:ribonuclease HI